MSHRQDCTNKQKDDKARCPLQRAAECPQSVWPDPLLRFVELFNARLFWDSHEVLESPWRINRSDFYQGLIIYASAFVHAQRGNPVGVRKQLAKVPGKLTKYRPHYMGVDVEAILRHGQQCIDFVSVPNPPRGAALARSIDYPTLTLDAHLLRGDEPELNDETTPTDD